MNLFRWRQRKDEELNAEIQNHLDEAIRDRIERGETPDEARANALREFGNIGLVKEVTREMWGWATLERLGQDLRFGLRMLRKNPGFSLIAILTLALGIGANTAIFSVVNTLLLRSLPVNKTDELALLATVNHNGPAYNFSYPLYKLLRDESHSFAGLFAATDVSKRRMQAGGTEAEFIRAQEVSGNFFAGLRVSALLGRTLTPEDDRVGQPVVVVISHSFWQRRFGADPAVIGWTLTYDDLPATIVGVTPPGFFGYQPGEHPDLWGPVQVIWEKSLRHEGRAFLHLMGRLPANVNRTQVQAELDVIFQRHLVGLKWVIANWDESDRRAFFDRHLEVQPGAAGYTDLRRQFRRSLWLLLTAVGLVLLIACANLASLLLARAAARQREFAVRSALGAGRLRLVRQLLTESLLLAALGGLLGLLFAQWGTRALLILMRLEADAVSFSVAPDARVLLFTLAATLLTGLLFGVVPALRSSRLELASALKRAGGSVAGDASRQRLNQALVVTQVALSLVLLIGAALFVRTLQKLNATDAGFNRENVVVFNLDFTQNLDPTRRLTLYKELVARLEALPGARAAGLSSDFLLGQRCCNRDRIMAEGYAASPGAELNCDIFEISPRFFETTGTPLIRGRGFGPPDERPADPADANAPQTAIINQAMARRYFGDANPLGRRFYSTYHPEKKIEIVGVVKDIRHRSLREPATPAFYLPLSRVPGKEVGFAVRTSSDSGALTHSLRQVAREVNPAIQVRDVRSLNEVVNTALHQERVVAQLGGFFSLFALVLACLGLYGVLSFAVVQGTREIGVRIALGAQRKEVLALVMGRGLKLAVLGVALGLVAAAVVMRFVESLFYGVTATDPVVFVGVPVLLLAVALLACWIPARRATKVDPLVALRHE
jgi:predicted permease